MKSVLFVLPLLLLANTISSQNKTETFSNPLLEMGPDPWMTFHDGFYFYTHTLQNKIEIRKTENPVDLRNAPRKVVWTAPKEGMNSAEIWAPEIHYLDSTWYIYFAADDGKNENHRMWVLACDSQNPMTGQWTVKSKLTDPGDHWAIDGSILEHDGERYFIWSGWETHTNIKQDIYISEMENPWTLRGERVLLSSPTAAWELNGLSLDSAAKSNDIFVNEGPQMLENEDNLFIIFSANGCWTDLYSLGVLRLKEGGNVMRKDDWIKSDSAFFKTSEKNQVFAPGHNSFFKSSDGTEDWILYHANPKPNQGCGLYRSPRAQKVEWLENGYPHFGEPQATGQITESPSGTK